MLLGIIGHRTRPHDIYRLLSISHWIFNQLGRARERARGEKRNIIIIKNIREKLRGKDEEMGMKKRRGKREFNRRDERETERKTFVCFSISFLQLCLPLQFSPVGSLAKRRPNEQGQTQLTPSVSDRYDCVSA